MIGPDPMIKIFLMSVRFGISPQNLPLLANKNVVIPNPFKGEGSASNAFCGVRSSFRQSAFLRASGLLHTRISRKPILRQIIPVGIRRLNQCHFLLSAPALNFFLAPDRHTNVLETLKIHQPMNPIFRREARNAPFSMLPNSLLQTTRYSGVDDSRSARQDINEVSLLHRLPLQKPFYGIGSRSLATLGMTIPFCFQRKCLLPPIHHRSE